MTKANLQPLRAAAVAATLCAITSFGLHAEFAPANFGDAATKGPPPNNAPTLTANFRQGTPVQVNDPNPPGDPVADLEEVYADQDLDPLAGAAVTTNNSNAGEGEWQYSSNGGGSWLPIPTAGLSDSNALLLAPNWRVRFVPALNFQGAAGTLAGRVWDGNGTQTPGPGQVLMPTDIGGSGGFSSALLDVTVTVLNDNIFADGFE